MMSKENNHRIDEKHPWDYYSDQPEIIRDKQYKRSQRKKYILDHIKTLLTSVCIFPVALIAWPFFKRNKKTTDHFFSLCVNLDKGSEQVDFIEELGCSSIQVRFYLSEIDQLDEYEAFLTRFSSKNILLTLVQSKQHIDHPDILARDVQLVFSRLSHLLNTVQVGTTINRSKWGFFSTQQYFEFYKTIEQVRDQNYPDLKLLGPSVIDFEYHYVMRGLFNFKKIKFDGVASLLYVDRRGAPENKQLFIFDTLHKISFLHTLMRLSPLTSNKLYLTEANWPLENTAPWAPTSETECVSEADYANYLVRYYLNALASRCVESVYWHQLIANGYGLIDTRNGIRKREAFYAFQTMIKYLSDTNIQYFHEKYQVFHLCCENQDSHKTVHVLWCNQNTSSLEAYLITTNLSADGFAIYNKTGDTLDSDIMISDSPIYLIQK